MNNPYEVGVAFTKDFGLVEHALKRSGYVQPNKRVAMVDWSAFANSLGNDFFEQIAASGSANTLLNDPPRQLLANMDWSPENNSPLSNVNQLLVNGVCRVRNNFFHGEKFVGGPEGEWKRDETLILEAHSVLNDAIKFAEIQIEQIS